MSATNDMISGIHIPRMIRVKQRFQESRLDDVPKALQEKLAEKRWGKYLKPGMKIAITAGSRGIAHMPEVLGEICRFLKEQQCEPLIIPAMGSHGGATAQGQTEVLHSLGITEDSVGAPIRSSMDATCIYKFPDGFKVYVDTQALSADGIVVVNRIKPHTSFRGAYESGLMKMMTVGMGKQLGADQIHRLGPRQMGMNIERGGKKILEIANVIFGVALLENSYDQTCQVEVLLPDEIMQKEPALQKASKNNMPHILFENIDVLVVDRIGKNISGPGMDPNITFTFNPSSGIPTDRRAKRIIILDLTDETHGAAVGMGNGDFITRRLFEKIDFDLTYPNLLTANFPEPGRIPMIMDNQKLAIQAGLKTASLDDIGNARIVRIPDTLHLGEIEISEAMLEEAKANPDIEILGEAEELTFDGNGNLF